MDEPIDVERLPKGAGIRITVSFDREEAELVLGKADFEDQTATQFVHDSALAKAMQPWVRTYSQNITFTSA